MNAKHVLTAAAAWMSLVVSTGCGRTQAMKSEQLLFDARNIVKGAADYVSNFHTQVVADPFASGGPGPIAAGEPGRVIMGGPLGPNEPYANKGTFVKQQGFFVMPDGGQAELRLTLAMRELTALKVEVTAQPTGSQKFTATLPAADRWEEIIVPLDPVKLPAGCTVYDITVFQVDREKKATPAAALYIKSVRVRGAR